MTERKDWWDGNWSLSGFGIRTPKWVVQCSPLFYFLEVIMQNWLKTKSELLITNWMVRAPWLNRGWSPSPSRTQCRTALGLSSSAERTSNDFSFLRIIKEEFPPHWLALTVVLTSLLKIKIKIKQIKTKKPGLRPKEARICHYKLQYSKRGGSGIKT